MKPGARAIAIAAVVVAGAVAGLLVALRSDDPPASVDHVPKITQADRGNAPREGARSPSVGATPPVAHPPAPLPPLASAPRPPATDYMVGGVRIRDHRSGDRTPSAVPPAFHSPEGRKIPSQLTSEVAQRVRAVMTECAMTLPLDARGKEPRLDGTIEIAIKDRLATITSASVQLRDVNAPAAASLKRCIDERSVGVATSAGEEADVAGYAITLSFRL